MEVVVIPLMAMLIAIGVIMTVVVMMTDIVVIDGGDGGYVAGGVMIVPNNTDAHLKYPSQTRPLSLLPPSHTPLVVVMPLKNFPFPVLSSTTPY